MTQRKTRGQRTLYLAQLAVLTAVLLLLEITGLGFIKTPGLEFTIMTVPVIIGAIMLGPGAGAVLGGVFGLTSFWQAFGKSAFGVLLLQLNPVGAFITTVPTRVLMGYFCGLIFWLLKRTALPKTVQHLVASTAGALLNTLLFMASLLLFYFHAPLLQDIAVKLGTSSPVAFAFAFVGVQGGLEALICAVLGTAITRGLANSPIGKRLS